MKRRGYERKSGLRRRKSGNARSKKRKLVRLRRSASGRKSN
jgi:ribosomal protein S21